MFKQRFRTELIHDIRDFEQRNLLDVREVDEFMAGHIPNAQNYPLSTFVDCFHELDKELEYTLICNSGSRSKQVAQFLSKQGYQVINVMGGMSNYKGEISR